METRIRKIVHIKGPVAQLDRATDFKPLSADTGNNQEPLQGTTTCKVDATVSGKPKFRMEYGNPEETFSKRAP